MDYLLGILTGFTLAYFIIWPMAKLMIKWNEAKWCANFDKLVEHHRKRTKERVAAAAEDAISELLNETHGERRS